MLEQNVSKCCTVSMSPTVDTKREMTNGDADSSANGAGADDDIGVPPSQPLLVSHVLMPGTIPPLPSGPSQPQPPPPTAPSPPSQRLPLPPLPPPHLPPTIDDKVEQPACRDFLRGECKRKPCKFDHKISAALRQKTIMFCHDFQNGRCNRDRCKYIHCVALEEQDFYKTGVLPKHIKIDTTESPTSPVSKDAASTPPTIPSGGTAKYSETIVPRVKPIETSPAEGVQLFNGTVSDNHVYQINTSVPPPKVSAPPSSQPPRSYYNFNVKDVSKINENLIIDVRRPPPTMNPECQVTPPIPRLPEAQYANSVPMCVPTAATSQPMKKRKTDAGCIPIMHALPPLPPEKHPDMLAQDFENKSRKCNSIKDVSVGCHNCAQKDKSIEDLQKILETEKALNKALIKEVNELRRINNDAGNLNSSLRMPTMMMQNMPSGNSFLDFILNILLPQSNTNANCNISMMLNHLSNAMQFQSQSMQTPQLSMPQCNMNAPNQGLTVTDSRQQLLQSMVNSSMNQQMYPPTANTRMPVTANTQTFQTPNQLNTMTPQPVMSQSIQQPTFTGDQSQLSQQFAQQTPLQR